MIVTQLQVENKDLWFSFSCFIVRTPTGFVLVCFYWGGYMPDRNNGLYVLIRNVCPVELALGPSACCIIPNQSRGKVGHSGYHGGSRRFGAKVSKSANPKDKRDYKLNFVERSASFRFWSCKICSDPVKLSYKSAVLWYLPNIWVPKVNLFSQLGFCEWVVMLKESDIMQEIALPMYHRSNVSVGLI